MAEQTYRIFAVLDVESDQDESLPNSGHVSDLVYDRLQRLRTSGFRITEISVYPDAINDDIGPPASIHAALDLIKSYTDSLRADFDDNGFLKAADEGLRLIESGISFLRGCVQGIKSARTSDERPSLPQIRSLTRDNLDEAPEPILHIVAHQMGLADCAGMTREHLVQWIKRKLDGDKEEPKPN